MSNSLGKIFRLTTFGESHGPAIGGVIDGCPAGLELDLNAVQKELERRKPGQSKITTQRKEPDQVVKNQSLMAMALTMMTRKIFTAPSPFLTDHRLENHPPRAFPMERTSPYFQLT